MPRDGSGNYTLPAGYTAITGDTIQPSQHNPPLEDLATAMTNSLPRNGAAPMTGALDMATFKINNVGDPAASTDAVNRRSLNEATTALITTGGSATAYTLTLNGAQTLGAGLAFWAKVNSTNTGGATTLVVTPGGGGAAFASKAIRVVSPTGTEGNPAAGAMVANQRYLFQYDPTASSGTGAYILVNPSSPASFRVSKSGAAQTTVAGAGAWSIITWPAESFDAGAYFATNRWVPPAGLVLLTANITVTPSGNGYVYLSISKNGVHTAFVSIRPCNPTVVLTNQVTTIDVASGTDYYECYVMASAGEQTIEGASYFAGSAIRAA